MSYILEALKKAQAERQLGELPTIHVAPEHSTAGMGATRQDKRKPVLLALLAVVVVVAVAALLWRRPWSAAPAPALATTSPVVASTPAPASVPVPAPVPLPVAAPLPAPAPIAVAPAAPAPAPVLPPSRPAPSVAISKVAPETPPASPVPPAQSAPIVPVPVPAAVAQQVHIGTLRDLPDAIQRQIPQVAIGGSMYSADPANRMLLIDRDLRHEGEEIAPGLTLEKIMPKAAVFNYRGYRYSQPY